MGEALIEHQGHSSDEVPAHMAFLVGRFSPEQVRAIADLFSSEADYEAATAVPDPSNPLYDSRTKEMLDRLSRLETSGEMSG